MTRFAAPWLTCCLIALAAAPATAAEEFFTAMLADGTRLAGDEAQLQNWHDRNAQPSLQGRGLFDPNNPLRWLVNNSLPLAETPAAYVEFVGGDRLPGDVLLYQQGSESPYLRLPPHLVVRTTEELNWPDFGEETEIRVQTRWVQRVVWESRAGTDYRPGTLMLRDGRQIPFRSLRWADGSVTLLLDGGGIQEFSFADIAEAHLPRQDPWQSYVEQIALLSPACDSRLLQIETAQGLRVLTSLERFIPRHRHDAGRHENWYQTVQPAWSLDPFWIRFRTVRAWRCFAPQQAPLTLVAPASVEQDSTFGSGWPWRLDRNVRQEPLRAGGQSYGWGFGVHAKNELTFDLPAAARGFRTQVGLDEIVGDGGCVRANVSVNAGSEQRLFDSPVLVGSSQTADTGVLTLPAGEGRTLTLTVDPVASGRPPGADPFDIRDSCDWLEPEVHLDLEALKQDVRAAAFEQFAALEDWTPAESDAAAFILVNQWDETDPRDPRFRTLMKTAEPFVSMTRSLRVGPEDRWIGVAVDRPADPASKVQVRVKGRALVELAVPHRPNWIEPAMLLVPIEEFRGQTVPVELVLIPENESSLVNWRGVSLLDHRPGLRPLFEDDAALAQSLIGEGTAEVVATNPHSGSGSLKIASPGVSAPNLPGVEFPIREQPRLGEFRYIRFAWRKEGGQQIGLSLGHDGEIGSGFGRGPDVVRADGNDRRRRRSRRQTNTDDRGFRHGFRYNAGQGDPPDPPVLRLDGRAPDQWTVVTRDLYGDFGNFTLTGLGFDSPDGDAAWFDHIWLARTQEDFNDVARELPSPEAPPQDPNVALRADDRPAYGAIVSTVAPAFIADESLDGVWLLKEYRGRQDVVRTHPPAQGRPCILRAAVAFSKDSKPRLQLVVSHHENADWQLIVKADGQILHDSRVNADSCKDGWAEITVDLSPLAGRKTLLEIHNHPNDWSYEEAYWARAEIVEASN